MDLNSGVYVSFHSTKAAVTSTTRLRYALVYTRLVRARSYRTCDRSVSVTSRRSAVWSEMQRSIRGK